MLQELQKKIVACRKCPRLVRYLSEIRDRFPTYWCRPVPVFGDPNASLMLLGLAPGRFGSNRTGRMFTGDSSGQFLYKALHDLGLANQSEAVHRADKLRLKNTIITAVVRCAPPQNKPSIQEIRKCSAYFREEIKLLKTVRVVVALGKVAHDAFLRMKAEEEGIRPSQYKFGHGFVHHFHHRPFHLVDVYHPSRQNTNTGKLTMDMLKSGLSKAVGLAKRL